MARLPRLRTLDGWAVTLVAALVVSSLLVPPARALAATPAPGWQVVVDDDFATLAELPDHWGRYSGRFGSGPRNCASAGHAYLAEGLLHLRMAYEWGGNCGAGWYTGGVRLTDAYASVDQRVTVTFRVVSSGVSSHYNLPLRWPTTGTWPAAGEENYCESDSLGDCTTFLHYSNDPTVQVYHGLTIGTGEWHTLRAERRDHVVRIYVDDLTTPTWSYTGSSATLPDTLKAIVFQQECRVGGCPSGTGGSEDIQISHVTVENPS